MSTRGLAFEIDKIINSIECVSTGKIYQTEVESIDWPEISMIHKKDGWNFNWKREYKIDGHKLYKLTIPQDGKIQGLISLEQHHQHRFIEMHLIENAPHNQGKEKSYYGVAANLIAFACKQSYEAGFEGYVVFTAKTNLVAYYTEQMGAQIVKGRQRMGIFGAAAKKLVNSHYGKLKIWQ
jgi:hypothetical protein